MENQTKTRLTTEQKKERALKAARRMMEDGGPENVKARELAREIGVSIGTVYNLFGDLEDVIFLVIGEIYDELHQAVDNAAKASREAGEDTLTQLMQLSRAYIDFAADRTDLWAGVLAFNRRQTQDVPDWYRDKERALFDVLADTLATLHPKSATPPSPLASQALWAAVHGIITVSVGLDGMSATRDEVFEQIELVVTAVVAKLSR